LNGIIVVVVVVVVVVSFTFVFVCGFLCTFDVRPLYLYLILWFLGQHVDDKK
jgi:hypothetical protein